MEEMFLSGDQIAMYSTLSATGNGADRTVTLGNIQTVGSSTDIYRVVVTQTNGSSQFSNGQQVTVYNPDGTILMSATTVQSDAEQGAAAGDDYLIFTSGDKFVFDLNGFPSGSSSRTYSNDSAGQQGDTGVGDNDGELDFADVSPSTVCFIPGVMISTVLGPRQVQDLRPGDTVRDVDGLDVSILWSGSRQIPLVGDRAPRPILISAGSLGPNCPSQDLIVSPQHRLQITGRHVQSSFGDDAVLAPARGLTALPGVREMKGKKRVTYVAILLTRHAVLFANGAGAESLYPGPEAMRVLTPMQRQLVYRSVPGLAAEGASAYGPPAHQLLTVRETRSLVEKMKPRSRVKANSGVQHEMLGNDR